MIFNETAEVISQETIASGIYSMWIRTERIAKAARPGQFISVYPKDSARLLPRPISICEIGVDSLRIVYRIAGKGTEEFSGWTAGEEIRILGPLGNGFPLEAAAEVPAIMIGGGIGVPPLLELTKQLSWSAPDTYIKSARTIAVMGYRTSDTFLREQFEQTADVFFAATEDGSLGTRGNVVDALREHNITEGVIYACGPMPMLKAIKAYAAEHGMKAYISLEERMACGIGACLGCVVKSKHKDLHTNVNNKRICKEGPVFDAEEVDI